MSANREEDTVSELGITPSQAHYVLSKMVGDKKVTRKEIASYLALMQDEINKLEMRLEELRSLKQGDAEEPAPTKRRRRRARTTAAKPKKRAAITAGQRASRKLQGVYMSLLRRIPKSKRAQYQSLAKEKDRQAAVDAMKAVLGV
jgi:hypothetical protein